MKPTLQKKGSTAHAGRLVSGASKVKKGTNRQKGSAQKASETRKEETRLELKSGVDPSSKIKLQLFPVDEATRIGLEKDGANPFLELTLRAKKKISSVINHIHTKWGGSSIAAAIGGEPMLLPYQSHTSMTISSSSRRIRWTSKDTGITAGDVYTALQSPPIFRLSYGWFCDDEPPTQRVCPHNCVSSEKSMHKEIETTQETNHPAEADVESKVKMGQSHEGSTTSPWDDELTNLSIGGLLSEASLQGKLNNNNSTQQTQPPLPFNWDNSLTALSIGGLLSEASMQAKKMNNNNNKSDPKSFISSDSFDAIISSSSHLKNDPQFSILDAEETCNAFSFRKLSSSTKNVRVSVRATQDSSSNSFKFPGLLQRDREAEDICGREPKAELFPCPPQYNEDSRSLGLRGINWNESLGPFDLGNSIPWKI